MAKAPVDIPVQVSGLNDLQKLERKMEQLERDVTKLNAKFPKAANGIRKTGRAAASATGNVQRLGIAFRSTLGPIVAITGSIALLSKALNTVGGRNAELASLKNGLNGLVDSSDAAAEALLKIADKSGKATLFDEEDFTATFKLLTSFRNIGVDTYDRVSMAAADMAQVIGSKPKEAAMQLAKALEDPSRRVTDLARSGTVFTEQQKEQIKVLQQSGDLLGAQEIILAEIEKQYGGAAKAAGASGFAGALDGAGESWRDFLEALGQANESGAVEFLNGISKGLEFITKNFDVIDAAGRAVVDTIALPFKALFEGIASVFGPLDDFQGKFRGTLAVVTKVLTDITRNILVPVFKIVGQGIGNVIKFLAGLVVGVGKAMEGIVSTITGALRIIASAIEAFINATPGGLLLQLFGINAGAAASGALNSFADGIDGMAASVGNYASELQEAAAAARSVPGLDPSGNSANPFAGAGPKGASGATSGTSGEGSAKNADDILKRQLDAGKKLSREFEQQKQLLLAKNNLEKALLKNEFDRLKVIEQIQKTAAATQQQELTNQANEIASLERKKAIAAFGEDAMNQAKALIDSTNQQVENDRRRLELIEEGINPALADSLIAIENQFDPIKKILDEKIVVLETTIAQLKAEGGITDELEAQLEAIKGRKEELEGAEGAAKDKAKGDNPGKIQAYMDQLKADLADTEGMIVSLAQTVESEIGSAMSNAIIGLIDGTQTAEEAFANMFKNIGKAFIDMATQMIAKALVLQALGILTGGGSNYGGVIGGRGPQFHGPAFEGGGFTGNGARSGGVDGKGGFPAILHPNETVIDHQGAMGRYSAGGGGVGGGSRTIRFESTVINNVEYVTTEQAMAMSRQAANDGAKRGAAGGHSRSMRTLQNSRSQRARLGMS